MNGTPIKGSHWVAISFAEMGSCKIHSVELDWETARADDFEIQLRLPGENIFKSVAQKRDARRISADGKHITDTVLLTEASVAEEVRVFINQAATNWGVSLWQFDIFGHCTTAT